MSDWPEEFERRAQEILAPKRLERPFRLSPDGLSDSEKLQWQLEEDRKWQETVRLHNEEQRRIMMQGAMVFMSNRVDDIGEEIAAQASTGSGRKMTREERREENQRKHREAQAEKERLRLEEKARKKGGEN